MPTSGPLGSLPPAASRLNRLGLRRLARPLLPLLALLASAFIVAQACTDDGSPASDSPQGQSQSADGQAGADGALKIAFLADFSGALAEYGNSMKLGFDLAVSHVNAADGVWGQPVQVVLGDTRGEAITAIEEARRLIEIEGVHAIVGPIGSSVTLAVVESVAADAGVLVVSPSATSPQLTVSEDNDFLFRTSPSDAAQGPVLAQLADEQGLTNVGVLYRNDAWGQGLAAAFEDAWSGEISVVAIDIDTPSYIAELQQAAADGAEALVAIAYPPESAVFIRESLEQGLFDHFIFTDGNKSQDLVDAIGGAFLEGMQGTAPVSGPDTDALINYRTDFTTQQGEGADEPFVAQSYDAAIAVALAAEHAGTADRSAIRDSLRAVAGPPGDAFEAGAAGVTDALNAIRNGDDIDFAGASTSLDWNDDGDITTGYIGVWQYADGTIEEVRDVAFDIPR